MRFNEEQSDFASSEIANEISKNVSVSVIKSQFIISNS